MITDQIVGSEDCLYLNVYTAKVSARDSATTSFGRDEICCRFPVKMTAILLLSLLYFGSTEGHSFMVLQRGNFILQNSSLDMMWL